MKLQFPPEFIFGVADADLQVIGENNTRKYENSEQTMWDNFAKTSGKTFQNQSPAEGIDRYHLFKEDIKIMRKLEVKDYRTSVSMARLLNRDGSVNSKALDWYKEYFKLLRKEDIKLYATLYHWELPQFLSEIGGWKNLKTAEFFVKHAETVYQNLGEYIEEYFIFNEPYEITFRGFYHGAKAPGETNLKNALLAAHNVLIAQGLAFKRLEELNKNLKLSTVYNVQSTYAVSANTKDIEATVLANCLHGLWFTDPLYLGKYPEPLATRFAKYMPKITDEDMKIIKIGDKLNALGINYYSSHIVKNSDKNELGFIHVAQKNATLSGIGKVIFAPPDYPEGFTDIITQLYFLYKNFGLKRMYIAENGVASDDSWNGKEKIVEDRFRISYFSEHFRQMHKAIVRGVPLVAYFAWTLMDNYEWAYGYSDSSRFGLVYINRKNMRRVLKESALWYRNLIKTHTLTDIKKP